MKCGNFEHKPDTGGIGTIGECGGEMEDAETEFDVIRRWTKYRMWICSECGNAKMVKTTKKVVCPE